MSLGQYHIQSPVLRLPLFGWSGLVTVMISFFAHAEPNISHWDTGNRKLLYCFQTHDTSIKNLVDWEHKLVSLKWEEMTEVVLIDALKDLTSFVRKHQTDTKWDKIEPRLSRFEAQFEKFLKKPELTPEQRTVLTYLHAQIEAIRAIREGPFTQDYFVESAETDYQNTLKQMDSLSKDVPCLKEERALWLLNVYARSKQRKPLTTAVAELRSLPTRGPDTDLVFAKALYHLSWLGGTSHGIKNQSKTPDPIDERINLAEEALRIAQSLPARGELSLDDRSASSRLVTELKDYLENLRTAKKAGVPSELAVSQKNHANKDLTSVLKEAPPATQDQALEKQLEKAALNEWYIFTVPQDGMLWDLAKGDSFLSVLPLQKKSADKSVDDEQNDRVEEVWHVIRESNPAIINWTHPLKKGTILKFPLWIRSQFLASQKGSESGEVSRDSGEQDLVTAYRRAIRLQLQRLKKITEPAADLIFRIYSIETLLDRKPPPDIELLKGVYSTSIEESSATLSILTRLLTKPEVLAFINLHSRSVPILEFIVPWVREYQFLMDAEYSTWLAAILVLKINQYASLPQIKDRDKLGGEQVQSFNYLLSKLPNYLAEHKESLQRLRQLWDLAQRTEKEGLNFPDWLEWSGSENLWSWIQQMSPDILYAYLETVPTRVTGALNWAESTKLISATEVEKWKAKFIAVKIPRLHPVPSADYPQIFAYFHPRVLQEDLEKETMPRLESLYKSLASSTKPVENRELLEWLGTEKVFGAVVLMNQELFQTFEKAYPDWVIRLNKYAETQKEKNQQSYAAWNKLQLISKIAKMDIKPPKGADAQTKVLYKTLAAKAKNGELSKESMERLTKLAEILASGGVDGLQSLVDWLGPDALTSIAKTIGPENLASLAKLFAKLLADKDNTIDLTKYKGLIETLAKAFGGFDFGNGPAAPKLPKINGPEINGLYWNTGIENPFKNFTMPNIKWPDVDFSSIKSTWRKLWGLKLNPVDYDLSELKTHDEISTQFQNAANNDRILFQNEDIHDGSYSYSTKMFQTLLSSPVAEPTVVNGNSDYATEAPCNMYANYLKYHIGNKGICKLFSTKDYVFNNNDYEHYSDFHGLTFLKIFHNDSSGSIQEIPAETQNRLILSEFAILNQHLDWLPAVKGSNKNKGLG